MNVKYMFERKEYLQDKFQECLEKNRKAHKFKICPYIRIEWEKGKEKNNKPLEL